MRQAQALSFLCAFVVLAATGCGGSKKPAPAATTTASVSQQLAAAIKTRLAAAGYTVTRPPNPSGSAPSPRPVRTFRIRVDYTSPGSFSLYVVVFASPADAAITVKRAAAACNASARCRAYQRQQQRTYRQKVLGAVVYSATSDDGHSIVPTARFDRLVAIASGRSTASP